MATSSKQPAAKQPTGKQVVSKSKPVAAVTKATTKTVAKASAAKTVESAASAASTVTDAGSAGAFKPATKRRSASTAPVSDRTGKKAVSPKTAAKNADKGAVPAQSKLTSTAATPGARSVLNPANAWPFPTGARPK